MNKTKLILSLLLLISFCLVLFASDTDKLNNIRELYQTNNLANKNDEEIIETIAMSFVGTKYKGGTLDSKKEETCTVFLDKFDCVTYFETVIAISSLLKNKQNLNIENIISKVTKTRYRNENADTYLDRLHYTSEWIAVNRSKGRIKDIGEELKISPQKFNLSFMSKNSDLYPQLKGNKNLNEQINEIEKEISKYDFYIIDKNDIDGYYDYIQSGDIIAIATNMEGLDYSHIGFAIKKGNKIHLLHASSSKKKVILDIELQEYLMKNKKQTGVSILRPIL